MILSAKTSVQESKIRENFADDRLLNTLKIRRSYSKKVKAKLERIKTLSRENRACQSWIIEVKKNH
jgi:hypothetical protein